ncbi:MAG: hypothetical protein WC867_01125 [Candidatus Pacearchaeota archaeon]
MKCILCKQQIEKYNPIFNRLKINELNEVDICEDCIKKFFNWQGELYAKLFPTEAMKKRFGKK